MSLTQPVVPLKDHCSMIYNGTLYTYQSDAFQSLDLQPGGAWTKLPMGVSTNGSACVQGFVDNSPSFIVVGGVTSTQHYNGSQHYSFEDKTWQSDSPTVPVEANRTHHGAVYLPQYSSILTYAGSQDNTGALSSETFTISTLSPYAVRAFSSDAPPVTQPLVLQFNASHALILGGNPTNTKIYLFSPDDGWRQMEASLQKGLKDSTQVQASLMDGSDGSVVLEIFDFSASPNQLTSILVQKPTGSPNAGKGRRSYKASPHHPGKRQKVDTSSANRPAYNSTLAPHETRTRFSLASDPSTGLVVASGGNSQAPFAMFNQTANQWIDPNQFFGIEPSPSAANTIPFPSATRSASATPVPSAVVAANKTVRHRSLTVLGGVLGGVFGAALLLCLVLFLLRWHRRRKEVRRQRRPSQYTMDDKEDMDFTDIGADFMKSPRGPTPISEPRRQKSIRSDQSAKTMVVDRSGAASSQSKRALLHTKGDSAGSGHSFWSRNTKSSEKSPPFISAPIMEHPSPRTLGSPVPDPRTEPRTADTGWSRYFAENNSRDMFAAQHGEERPDTYLSMMDSDYTLSRVPSSLPHQSAEIEPLHFRSTQPGLPPSMRAPSPPNYPSLGLGLALTHGTSTPNRVDNPTLSRLDMVSDIDEEDELSHHYSHGESSGHDSWTPVPTSGERDSSYSGARTSAWTDDRPISSWTHEGYPPPPSDHVPIPNFPMPNSAHASLVNSPTTSPLSPSGGFNASPSNRGLRNIASRDFVRSNSDRQQATSDIRTGMQRVTPDSTPVHNPDMDEGAGAGAGAVSRFPRPRERKGLKARPDSQTEDRADLSWLNLGTSAEKHNNLYHPE